MVLCSAMGLCSVMLCFVVVYIVLCVCVVLFVALCHVVCVVCVVLCLLFVLFFQPCCLLVSGTSYIMQHTRIEIEMCIYNGLRASQL